MPFRDHFRPPVLNTASWEGFFGGWPAATKYTNERGSKNGRTRLY